MLIKTQLTGNETDLSDIQQICFQIEQEVNAPFAKQPPLPTMPDLDEAPKPILFNQPQVKKHPIIFLDIDGVLYPFPHNQAMLRETNDKAHFEQLSNIHNPMLKEHLGISVHTLNKLIAFDFEAIQRIRQLCEKLDARIVVSSDWRKGRNVNQLTNLFQLLGLGQWVIDRTGHSPYPRGDEIQAWLTQHIDKVASFVVIDDNLHDFADRFLLEFVHCNRKKGFTENKLHQAFDILQNPKRYLGSLHEQLWQALCEKNLPQAIELSYERVGIMARHNQKTMPEIIELFVEALANSDNVKAISLKGFNDENVIPLCKAILQSCQSLQTLNVQDSCLTFTSQLVESLNKHPCLTHLDISDCRMLDDDRYALMRCAMHRMGLHLQIDDYRMVTEAIDVPAFNISKRM